MHSSNRFNLSIVWESKPRSAQCSILAELEWNTLNSALANEHGICTFNASKTMGNCRLRYAKSERAHC